jgi:carboxymethylenebutenolidase
VEGFITLAPDALSPLGGYPGNDDDGRELQKKRTREEMLEDFIAAYDYLKSHKDCNGQVGVVGFCFEVDCQYEVKFHSISSSALLWRTAHCSRSRTNNNTLLLHYAGLDSR